MPIQVVGRGFGAQLETDLKRAWVAELRLACELAPVNVAAPILSRPGQPAPYGLALLAR